MLINLQVLQSVELHVHFNIYFLYLANTFISQNHQPQNIFKPKKKYGSLFNQTITFPIRLYITIHSILQPLFKASILSKNNTALNHVC